MDLTYNLPSEAELAGKQARKKERMRLKIKRREEKAQRKVDRLIKAKAKKDDIENAIRERERLAQLESSSESDDECNCPFRCSWSSLLQLSRNESHHESFIF